MDGTTDSSALDLEAHLPRLTARGAFGIKESAARAALSRMVTGGDLIRTVDGFHRSSPLLERCQRALHEVRQPTGPWGGEWEIVG
ncbi:hypothetical protein [Rhodococcus sp. NPDC059234]|uniref:hypothetical protein n=1 Tax=Rhodococcus sp. NPDC059234 TaxID=3346781 RepID=UPI00366B9E13